MENYKNLFYMKLGMITHHQSNIEYHLSTWIIKLIDNDDLLGLIITSEMSFKNLMNCLNSILLLRKDEDQVQKDEYVIKNYTSI